MCCLIETKAGHDRCVNIEVAGRGNVGKGCEDLFGIALTLEQVAGSQWYSINSIEVDFGHDAKVIAPSLQRTVQIGVVCRIGVGDFA